MKNLLTKEPCRYKIHALLMKANAFHSYIIIPPIWITPNPLLQQNHDPPPFVIPQKSQLPNP